MSVKSATEGSDVSFVVLVGNVTGNQQRNDQLFRMNHSHVKFSPNFSILNAARYLGRFNQIDSANISVLALGHNLCSFLSEKTLTYIFIHSLR